MVEAVVIPPNEPVSIEAQVAEMKAGGKNAELSTNGDTNGDRIIADPQAVIAAQEKYAAEREKRLLPLKAAQSQYLDINQLADAKPLIARFAKDPWLTPASDYIPSGLHDGAHVEHLILGAGMTGLLAGIRLTSRSRVPQTDIYTVDEAGDWGGTWYWNRFPGLMCDSMSYHYLPLLQETGYMPKHRYSYGGEIRQYLIKLVERYGLGKTAMFRTKVEGAKWDDDQKRWTVSLRKKQGSDSSVEDVVMTVHTRFLTLGSGVLVNVKLPNVEGLLDYQGHMFHSSRWDFDYTGGNADDPHPQLSGLKDKRVAVIGTGATSIQLIPEVAKFAKELYVVQRTPSTVNRRGQAPTDIEWWNTNIQDPSWLKRTASIFSEHFTGNYSTPLDPMFKDAWLNPALRTWATGEPMMRPEDIPAYVARLHAEDLPVAEGNRARVDQIVHDPKTAAELKAWYPSWCKRPAFHDDYLPAFNKPNVHLVDTQGKGLSGFTRNGIVANETEYLVDAVIFSTGFRAPADGWHGKRANMEVVGRNGRTIDEKFNDDGFATLHGLLTNEFPNLFIFGPPFQSGITSNYGYAIQTQTDHLAYVFAEASKRAAAAEGAGRGSNNEKWTIEVTKKAEEDWTMQILMRAASFAGMAGCTPGYNNGEGAADQLTMEEQMKRARGSPWGEGIEGFRSVIEAWRVEGSMDGVEVKVY